VIQPPEPPSRQVLGVRIDAPGSLRERIRSALEHPERAQADVIVTTAPPSDPGGRPIALIPLDGPPDLHALGSVHAVARDLGELGRTVPLAWLRAKPRNPASPRWLAAFRRVTGADEVVLLPRAEAPSWFDDPGGGATEPVVRPSDDGDTVRFALPTSDGVLVLRTSAARAPAVWEVLQAERRLWQDHGLGERMLREIEHALRSPTFVVRMAARVLGQREVDPSLVQRLESVATEVLDAPARARRKWLG